MKKLIKRASDIRRRHRERHTSLNVRALFADSIDFIHPQHWDALTNTQSIFMGRAYLQALEQFSPNNTCQRYALAYDGASPIVALACQVAEISGDRLAKRGRGLGKRFSRRYRERVLVCGNLVSSGLHGVAFSTGLDPTYGWRVVAELLYKMRRAEKLDGSVDFVLIKDLKGSHRNLAAVMERYSYRFIRTEPDMVLDLQPEWRKFDDYLADLTTKYRQRARKVIDNIHQAGFVCERVHDVASLDAVLHQLYLEVEGHAPIRLATLAPGYFGAMAKALGDSFACSMVRRNNEIAGFVTTVRDGEHALAYYVGVNYQLNAVLPVYFRLLQITIEHAIGFGAKQLAFGRTASGVKANLGATAVYTYLLARHRIPAVNFWVRKLFRLAPQVEVPVRSVRKTGN